MDPIELDVIKQGETSFSVIFFRSRKGLQLEVRAHPNVEDFVRSLGTGDTQEVRTMGRYWEPVDKSLKLEVYNLSTNPGSLMAEDGTTFRIDQVGMSLLDSPESGGGALNWQGQSVPIINLSFIRLVGISKGISFTVAGVYTNDEVRALSEKIGVSYKRLYGSYIKPLKMVCIVSTQEIPTS